MKRYPWRLIAFLALVLMFSVIAGWAAMTQEVARSKKTGSSFDFGLALVAAAVLSSRWREEMWSAPER